MKQLWLIFYYATPNKLSHHFALAVSLHRPATRVALQLVLARRIHAEIFDFTTQIGVLLSFLNYLSSLTFGATLWNLAKSSSPHKTVNLTPNLASSFNKKKFIQFNVSSKFSYKSNPPTNCVISSDGLAILYIRNWLSREIYHNGNAVLGIL